MLLLHLLLFFFQTVACTFSADFFGSETKMFSYTVYPTDPSNVAKITETETLLKNLDRDAEFSSKPGQDGSVIWTIVSSQTDLINAISAVEGVRHVEQKMSNRIELPEGSRLVRRGEEIIYMVTENTSVDTLQTEQFLKTKVKLGTTFKRYLSDDGTESIASNLLVLDEDAQKAVLAHKGVVRPLFAGGREKDQALPAEDRSPHVKEYSKMLIEKKKLLARAGDWQKQENADDALKTVSQYP